MFGSESLEDMTSAELRALASEYGITGVTSMRKPELLAHLEQVERLSSLKVGELRQLAKQAGLKNVGGLKKQALIGQLVEAERGSRPADDEIPREAPATPERLVQRPLMAQVMQLTGGLGVVLSLLSIVVVSWLAFRWRGGLQLQVTRAADQVRGLALVLEAASGGLASASVSLRSSAEALAATQENLENSNPLLESLNAFVGEEAPDVIEATRRSLLSAQAGAAAIDQVLQGLASLGPLTGVDYDPEQTLQDSLAEAAAGLAPLPSALRGLESDLDLAASDLDLMQLRISSVARDLHTLAENLERMEDTLTTQVGALEGLADTLDQAAGRASNWLVVGAAVLNILLAWNAVSQYAVYVVGSQYAQSAEGKSVKTR